MVEQPACSRSGRGVFAALDRPGSQRSILKSTLAAVCRSTPRSVALDAGRSTIAMS